MRGGPAALWDRRRSALARKLRVGVDSGGPFTDVCMFDETHGEIHVWKVSSTPQDPPLGIAGGIEQGVAEVAKAAGQKTEVVYFGHGTTVATNALIVGRGAETGLITTKGFRDVLELRRQKRDSLYDIQTQKPRILVTRDKRLEVSERVRFDGSILTPLDKEEVRAAARKLKAEGISTVAVCFLFSFIEPAHESRVKELLAEEMPGAFISISHEVAPEFRERVRRPEDRERLRRAGRARATLVRPGGDCRRAPLAEPVVAGIGEELAGLGPAATRVEHRRRGLIGEELVRRLQALEQPAAKKVRVVARAEMT